MADDDPDRPSEDAEVGAAVDDALSDELKRQRARFVQALMGVDCAEGVGRGEAHWNDSLYRDVRPDPPTPPADPDTPDTPDA